MTATATGAWLPVYAQFPLRVVSGAGSYLVDDRGERWLDAYGGHAVASTGHCHPDVVAAIREQAGKLIFYSTAIPHGGREELAELIAANCPDPLGKVFFCNSGAEANENALSLARKVTGRQRIVSVAGGWHGRTAATLAVTDGAKYEETARRSGISISTKVPFNDVQAIAAAIDETVAGVIVEPVQGLTGARDCSPEFLRAARLACDREGAVLIFDEIQCGVGRCGAFSAAEAFEVIPDILTFAKGLASGLPIGAMVATGAVTASLKIGDLGSTFGGGPVVSAAAIATIKVILKERLIDNAVMVGDHLRRAAAKLPGVADVQGRGLLIGLRLAKPAAEVQRALFESRILTGTSSEPTVLRLMPPLSFSRSEANTLIDALRRVLS
ncbi:MAG: aminotransferase class III-fold pyridoxal phosphate-dependent enzyme [Gemmatimonadetes bacterium]|nr:aminotransferase class III-fold pyridoxal phosphate-dependent enzyme [Gemmatimonadota bacterium]